ncbi:hypothetical protein [Halostella sp. PRR32]|uniref:DUF7519 family protein n=1 Tax=Halostella sp. PRR32 TaxID=3098147 RepID=UPI002B1CE46D|nr:hypothetical protein [Halostella sp. PRR32]
MKLTRPFVSPDRAANGDASPPETSRLLVTAIVGAGVLFVGSQSTVFGQVVESSLTAFVVAVALSLLNEDEPEMLALGCLLLAPAGASLAGDLISIASGPPIRALRALALVVASGGLGVLWTGSLGNRTLTVAISRFGYALFPLSVTALGAMVWQVGAVETAAVGEPVLAGLWEELVAPSGPGPRIADFLLLLAVSAYVVRAAIDRLPVAELARNRNVERRVEQVRTARKTLRKTYRLAAPAGILLGILTLVGAGHYEALPGPVVALLGGIASLSLLRTLLVFAFAGSLVVITVVDALLWARNAAASDLAPRIVPFASGLAFVAAVVLFTEPVLARVRDRTPAIAIPVLEELVRVVGETPVALLVVSATLLLFTVLAGAVAVLGWLGFLTDRVAPVSVASSGLFVAALVSGVIGDRPVVVYVGVATAIVAWDVGEFGVGVTEELGRNAWSRQGELTHALTSAAVGVGTVLSAFALHGLMRRSIPDGTLAAAGAVAAFVGTLLLLSRLR